MKCVGECSNTGNCEGEVKKVLVSGNGWKNPWHFEYCQTAQDLDRERGFLVEDDAAAPEFEKQLYSPDGQYMVKQNAFGAAKVFKYIGNGVYTFERYANKPFEAAAAEHGCTLEHNPHL